VGAGIATPAPGTLDSVQPTAPRDERPVTEVGVGGVRSFTMKADEVAAVWSCSTWLVYRMVNDGTCPVEPIRLGARKLVWPRASVERSLGLVVEDAGRST
jgi:predicted DNA-binding transcriptional regulator AlpA